MQFEAKKYLLTPLTCNLFSGSLQHLSPEMGLERVKAQGRLRAQNPMHEIRTKGVLVQQNVGGGRSRFDMDPSRIRTGPDAPCQMENLNLPDLESKANQRLFHKSSLILLK